MAFYVPPRNAPQNEPRGFGEHTRGLAGEYAHEQGWHLREEQRTLLPRQREEYYGGEEYDYGSAQDFGDTAVRRA